MNRRLIVIVACVALVLAACGSKTTTVEAVDDNCRAGMIQLATNSNAGDVPQAVTNCHSLTEFVGMSYRIQNSDGLFGLKGACDTLDLPNAITFRTVCRQLHACGSLSACARKFAYLAKPYPGASQSG